MSSLEHEYNMEKYLSIHSFSVMGHTFWKENVEDRVKLLELNVLNKNEEMTFQRT